jgi:hypothetical protein
VGSQASDAGAAGRAIVALPRKVTVWMAGASGPVAEGLARVGLVARSCGEHGSAWTAALDRAASGSETANGLWLDSEMRAAAASNREVRLAAAKWVEAAPAADPPGG